VPASHGTCNQRRRSCGASLSLLLFEVQGQCASCDAAFSSLCSSHAGKFRLVPQPTGVLGQVVPQVRACVYDCVRTVHICVCFGEIRWSAMAVHLLLLPLVLYKPQCMSHFMLALLTQPLSSEVASHQRITAVPCTINALLCAGAAAA
jgi:hypothetical protein